MRIVSFVLLIYVLTLTAIPCCAFDNCPDDKSKTEQTAGHEKGGDDCGSCSPFFNCSDCTTVTIVHQSLRFDIPALPVISVYNSYLQTTLPRVDSDFWQPPKLD